MLVVELLFLKVQCKPDSIEKASIFFARVLITNKVLRDVILGNRLKELSLFLLFFL